MPSDQRRTRILHKWVQLEMSVVRQYVKHWAQEVVTLAYHLHIHTSLAHVDLP